LAKIQKLTQTLIPPTVLKIMSYSERIITHISHQDMRNMSDNSSKSTWGLAIMGADE